MMTKEWIVAFFMDYEGVMVSTIRVFTGENAEAEARDYCRSKGKASDGEWIVEKTDVD